MTNSQPTDPYRTIMEAAKVLQDLDGAIPLNQRIVYYYKHSWWGHPIKRWRQERRLKKLLETTDD